MRPPRARPFRRLPGIALAALWALPQAGPGAALAQAAPAASRSRNLGDLEALLGESVVTTASKSAESANTAPAQIVTITAEQIRGYGIRTVAEALNFLGVGMYAARTAENDLHAGVVTEVGARGILFPDGGSRVLVLLDGHTTNSQIDGRSFLDENLGVPIEMIDHIEVVLGPGSVMYGSSAFLGVVNVVTRRARDLRGLIATAQVTAQPPQGSDRGLTSAGNGDSLGLLYRLSLSFGHEFTLFKKRAELVAQGEWQAGTGGSYRVGPQYGDYTGGYLTLGTGPWQGVVQDTTSALSLLSTLRVGDVRLGVHIASRDRGMPLASTLGAPDSGANIRHFGLDLSHNAQLGRRFTLSSRLYLDATEQTLRQTLAMNFPTEFPLGLAITTRRLSQWMGLEEQGAIDWRSDGSLVTTMGFDARGRRSQAVEQQEQDAVTGVPSQLQPAGSISSLTALGGGYVQQVYQPLRWLGLNAGLRLDLDALFGWHLSPRAAAVFTPWRGGAVKLMYAEAFRAPTPLEVEGHTLFQRIRPSGLRPEVVRSVEAEVSQSWPGGRVTLNGFYSIYQDMISGRTPTQAEYGAAVAAGEASTILPPGGYSILDNLGAMTGYGGSLRVEEHPIPSLRLGLNVLISNSNAQNRDGAPQVMLLTPSWFGNARIRWQPRPDGPSLGLAVSVVGPRQPYLSSDAPAAPIALPASADLRLSAALPIAGLPGLSLRAVADYNTEGRSPIQVGGPVPRAPTAQPELLPLPRAFFLLEVRYAY